MLVIVGDLRTPELLLFLLVPLCYMLICHLRKTEKPDHIWGGEGDSTVGWKEPGLC